MSKLLGLQALIMYVGSMYFRLASILLSLAYLAISSLRILPISYDFIY